MSENTTEPPPKLFVCDLCGLNSPFTYYGQKPPNTRAIVLLEECFVTKDPFSPDKEKFLILGSTCSLCNKCVCVGADCSLFYTKRFCLQCVNKHLDQFPDQIRAELAKKRPSSSAAVSWRRARLEFMRRTPFTECHWMAFVIQRRNEVCKGDVRTLPVKHIRGRSRCRRLCHVMWPGGDSLCYFLRYLGQTWT